MDTKKEYLKKCYNKGLVRNRIVEELSTPERKKEYVRRWLNENPSEYSEFEESERTPPSSPMIKNTDAAVNLQPPVVHKKQSTTPETSPIFGGKRLAQSPIIGRKKKFLKKFKTLKKINFDNCNVLRESKFCDLAQSNDASKINESEDCIDSSIHIDFKKQKNLYSYQADFHHQSHNTNWTFDLAQLIDQPSSQIIESVSSSDSADNKSVIIVQEVASDIDKTASDLVIEEIQSQVVLDQNLDTHEISNPSSSSSDSCIQIKTLNPDTFFNSCIDQQNSETVTNSNIIEACSTQDSKNDNRTCYILQPNVEKTKKKCMKKGGLLDTLMTSLGKKRSNVNFCRHQISTNTFDMKDNPYIDLQILQLLQVINNNQIFKCFLIEDKNCIMEKYLNNSNKEFINVMIVPEVSGIVNLKQQPCLRVFEPLNVIDPSQNFLEISKFIALPTVNTEDHQLSNKTNSNYNLVYNFHCLCIEEGCLSHKCTEKFCNVKYDYAKSLFDC